MLGAQASLKVPQSAVSKKQDFWLYWHLMEEQLSSVLRKNYVTCSLTFGIPGLRKTFPLTCLSMQQTTHDSNTESLKNHILHKNNDGICLFSWWSTIPSYLYCCKSDIVACFLVGYSCTEVIKTLPVPKPKSTAQPQ